MSSVSNKFMVENVSVCPSCDSSRLRELPAPEHWIDAEHFVEVKKSLRLSRCQDCGLVIVNPRPSRELLTSFYNKPGYQCHDLNYDGAEQSYASARFGILERLCPKGLLLDYGCGAGNMLKASTSRGWRRVTGVEIGAKVRARMQKNGFEVYSDLSSASALRGQVDALTMIQVLEHLVEPSTVLRQVWEMLCPAGIFVVEVPNAGSLRARIAGSPLATFLPHPVQRYQAFPIHLYHFEARQLIALLRKHGFEVAELHTLGMGVEELWAPQTAMTPLVRHARVTNLTKTLRSGSFTRLFKSSIKSGMSRLRLGEQLFVVCRKVDI